MQIRLPSGGFFCAFFLVKNNVKLHVYLEMHY
jgi:hypothetical protein